MNNEPEREFENFIDMSNYYRTKAYVLDTLESAHWYLLYSTTNSNEETEGRVQAAATIDKARRQLLKESQDRAITKHRI